MINKYKMFMLVVEEMSFSKAANRAFVTQQCLSDHIKKLEKAYDIKLFHRRPKLALTQSGEAMVNYIQKFQILENSLISELTDIKGERNGHIILGINPTRARILLPSLFAEYHNDFENVKLSAVFGDTKNLEQMLLNGKINMFIGINTSNNKNFKYIRLMLDKVYLVASNELLSKYYVKNTKITKETFKSGIDLKLFKNMPFVRNYTASTLNNLIDKYTEYNNIDINTTVSISDYDIQINLCSLNQVAAFCPGMVLNKVIEYNEKQPENKQLHIFPLVGLNEGLKVDLIYNINTYQPLYVQEFITMLKMQISDFNCKIEGYLQ